MLFVVNVTGYPVSKLFKITAPDWKSDVPFTLDSDIRLNFTKPVQQEELKNPVGRYTSNRDKHKIPKGIGQYLQVQMVTYATFCSVM